MKASVRGRRLESGTLKSVCECLSISGIGFKFLLPKSMRSQWYEPARQNIYRLEELPFSCPHFGPRPSPFWSGDSIGTAPYGSARSLFLKPEHTVIWASGPVYYPQAKMRRRRIFAPLAAICQYAAIPDQTQRLFLIFFRKRRKTPGPP